MTFQEWQATRKWHDDLSKAPNTDWAWDASGFTYDDGCGGCIEASEGGASPAVYRVVIANTEEHFSELEAAEKYLWDEYAFPEIYTP